ncbi:Sugar transport protein [Operophtera brumata]|uniref:Sugar transport protein n=1 Tax=Operophtera brumata TaxID=104452 RepID=A0A0L7LC12_OPEBR|nr:Sugar transport protein [Operophtera brumata]
MACSFKLLGAGLLLVFIVMIQAKPLEESKAVAESGDDEMMETAESQNPFLPRFAMRKLKEKREQARAQRRNQGVQGERRNQNNGGYQGSWRQPYGVPCPHYVSIYIHILYRT